MAVDAEHGRLVTRDVAAFAPRCEIDGAPATAEQLAHLVRFNHGHFTSFQVRDGGVRGFDLHLARLQASTRELFGATLDPDHVRSLLRHAMRDTGDASVRINIFAPDWSIDTMLLPARIGVMINVLPPLARPQTPLRLQLVEHERYLPHIKHVAAMPLFEHRARARRAGLDDALFVDRHGHVSEGTIWNIGFRAGDRIVLPDAAQLDGIALQLLQRGLDARGIACERATIPRTALAQFDGAFVCNASAAGQPVASIDDIAFAIDDTFVRTIVACYESNPLQPI